MTILPVPPVPDLARVPGGTQAEAVRWLREYFQAKKAFFSYVCATRVVKQSYKGLHSLPQLLAGCDREKSKQGKRSNREVVSCAAPLAFGRTLQVFDLPSRKFNFGRDRKSSFRIPFFFVENARVNLYFLQPRKSFELDLEQLGMVATIHKSFLLDNEFYGQPADVEYVDLSACPTTGDRLLQTHKLDGLQLWSHQKLQDRLTLISEALDQLETEKLDIPKRRPPPIHPDLPLF